MTSIIKAPGGGQAPLAMLPELWEPTRLPGESLLEFAARRDAAADIAAEFGADVDLVDVEAGVLGVAA